MVKMTANYQGNFHCELVHEPSDSAIQTDAPKDNMGLGESFSPTDLVGAALLSCILTTMAIVAKRDNVEMKGASGTVEKEMADKPRRIAALRIELTLPAAWNEDYRAKMQRVAEQCPVHKSLSAEVQIPMRFIYQ